MKADIFTFKRTEMKFLLTPFQYARLLAEIQNDIRPDDYPESRILNIYYDTPTDYLIRRSLEKPVYKEKLRLRTYGTPESASSPAFLEIKKKYEGIVYKRRIALPYGEATDYMKDARTFAEFRNAEEKAGRESANRYGIGMPPAASQKSSKKRFTDRQTERELDAFKKRYTGLSPRMVISYNRHSYVAKSDAGLRITFDESIRYRSTNLDLRDGARGKALLEGGFVLMEVKAAGALPLSLVRTFSRLGIRQTSFSKYGAAYMDELAAAREAAEFAVDKSGMPLCNLA